MSGPERRWLVPEVLQTSLMDCGPAALAAILEGFGIRASYDWLRARCATDVDGSSMDTLASLGAELGLECRQMLVPRDHLLLPAARCLPAIVPTGSAAGSLHFVVVWRTLGPFVQILDPSSGRHWQPRRRFLDALPLLPIPLSRERFRRWARSEDAAAPLRARLRELGMDPLAARRRIEAAAQAASVQPFARLDASVRMLRSMIAAGAVSRGRPAQRLLDAVLAERADGAGDPPLDIPPRFWWVHEQANPHQLLLRGTVIVYLAPRVASPGSARTRARPPLPAVTPGEAAATAPPAASEPAGTLPPTGSAPSARSFWQIAWVDARARVVPLALALVLSSLAAPIEVAMLRGLLETERTLALGLQRISGLLVLGLLVLISLLLERHGARTASDLGRRLEVRLRAALLAKLPLLGDDYLRTRPTSDLIGRGHAVHWMREIPVLGMRAAQSLLQLVATALALAWLYPEAGLAIALFAGIALALPLAASGLRLEATLRLRTHATALTRFYLDALLGAYPARVHGAADSVSSEHEQLLVEWRRTAHTVHSQNWRLSAFQVISSATLAALLVRDYSALGTRAATVLLFAFWALRIPVHAAEVVQVLQIWRSLRSMVLRLAALLDAPGAQTGVATRSADAAARGVALALEEVGVERGGRAVLRGVTLHIAAGAHVGIVGESGSGKSSLLGLLLGWLEASRGRVLCDDEPLTPERVGRLRSETVWVDPAVQLWEQSLYDNVTYGSDAPSPRAVADAISGAELGEVLEHLPEGLQTDVGESGCRLSGGQGQRVRLARALLRCDARLVLLDEPFRGLERERRRELASRVRRRWQRATLLFVSHDIEDTLDLDRVIVIAGGRIVEDGAPAVLSRTEGSRYRALLAAQRSLRSQVWGAAHWRRWVLKAGRLDERPSHERPALVARVAANEEDSLA